ncbi:hypothetical protein A2U01_0113406, partial [Trifolium medium]|nr:hypothetical protein [Trifolium medium]
HLGSFRYVETDAGIVETAFQDLEIANAAIICRPKASLAPRASITSWRKLKTALDDGYFEGWG